jgi:hypothetical protein
MAPAMVGALAEQQVLQDSVRSIAAEVAAAAVMAAASLAAAAMAAVLGSRVRQQPLPAAVVMAAAGCPSVPWMLLAVLGLRERCQPLGNLVLVGLLQLLTLLGVSMLRLLLQHRPVPKMHPTPVGPSPSLLGSSALAFSLAPWAHHSAKVDYLHGWRNSCLATDFLLLELAHSMPPLIHCLGSQDYLQMLLDLLAHQWHLLDRLWCLPASRTMLSFAPSIAIGSRPAVVPLRSHPPVEMMAQVSQPALLKPVGLHPDALRPLVFGSSVLAFGSGCLAIGSLRAP